MLSMYKSVNNNIIVPCTTDTECLKFGETCFINNFKCYKFLSPKNQLVNYQYSYLIYTQCRHTCIPAILIKILNYVNVCRTTKFIINK